MQQGRKQEQAGAPASAAEDWVALQTFAADVFVSDIGMSGIDGYGFFRRLRTRPAAQGGHAPALAYTAYPRPEDRERALAAGFHQHLGKPATSALLVQMLADLARPKAVAIGQPP